MEEVRISASHFFSPFASFLAHPPSHQRATRTGLLNTDADGAGSSSHWTEGVPAGSEIMSYRFVDKHPQSVFLSLV